MKLKGKSLKNDLTDYAVYPRLDGDLVFKITPVSDWSTFNELCPTPKPKTKTLADNKKEAYLEDKEYLKAVDNNNALRNAYLFINSLKETDGLEWEKVKLGEPDTWLSYLDELNELSTPELNDLFDRVLVVNSLSDNHIEKARARFLATLQTESK